MNNLKPIITSCALIIAIGSNAHGQERPDNRLPLKIASWDGISKRLNASEIVVVGMVNSFDAQDQDVASRELSTPGRKLSHYPRSLRELGGQAIPGLKDKVLYSDKISILVVESGNEGETAAGEAHKQKARSLYQMLGAHPYVLSNPVIFVIQKAKLVRCYGDYHEPGPNGNMLQQSTSTLLSPEESNKPLLPEIVMMKTLALREEKGDKEASAYLTDQFLQSFKTSRFYDAYSYFWTEAQVRSGAENPLWASMVFDILFTTCQSKGYYSSAMQAVSNLCSNLSACGRYGRLAEVMTVWEKGQKMAGNRLNISSYEDLRPAIPCLPEIRHRNMPITQPSDKTIPAGSNADGFHVNQTGAFEDYASLLYAAGRWQESLEYTIWVRDWATDKKTKQAIGEFATSWYGATCTLISCLEYMGFNDESLALVEEGLAAPHGQTYHGRWKIFLAAAHLNSLMLLDRAPSDIIEQYTSLIEKAKPNGHIGKSGVWGIQNQLDGTALAIDAQGNGSLLDQGDELFMKSDGAGNLILPLSKGNAAMNLLV